MYEERRSESKACFMMLNKAMTHVFHALWIQMTEKIKGKKY